MERCSFCGNESNQLGPLISSGTAAICRGCVEAYAKISRKESGGTDTTADAPGEPSVKSGDTVLDRIKARPGLFFGAKSLRSLFDYMEGFRSACLPRYHEAFGRVPYDFTEWVAYRTRFSEFGRNWCGILLESTGSDEQAFDRFFELLDAYESRKPTLVARLKNLTGYLASIREIVTYTDDPGFLLRQESAPGEAHSERFMTSLYWLHFHTGTTADQIEVVDETIFNRLIAENEARARCS